jgi:hypothetical protein
MCICGEDWRAAGGGGVEIGIDEAGTGAAASEAIDASFFRM